MGMTEEVKQIQVDAIFFFKGLSSRPALKFDVRDRATAHTAQRTALAPFLSINSSCPRKAGL